MDETRVRTAPFSGSGQTEIDQTKRYFEFMHGEDDTENSFLCCCKKVFSAINATRKKNKLTLNKRHFL
jgi:hypothetical protein